MKILVPKTHQSVLEIAVKNLADNREVKAFDKIVNFVHKLEKCQRPSEYKLNKFTSFLTDIPLSKKYSPFFRYHVSAFLAGYSVDDASSCSGKVLQIKKKKAGRPAKECEA